MQGVIGEVEARLDQSEPAPAARGAAVAVVFRNPLRPEVLLIRRAERAGDPWSGQVAFPGGKRQDGDLSARGTAEREALEEVGVDLGSAAGFLGYHGQFRTHTGDMVVVPAVFLLKVDVAVRPNAEVNAHFWVEFSRLPASGTQVPQRLAGGEVRTVPAFVAGQYVVWGLTHRILSSLLGAGGQMRIG